MKNEQQQQARHLFFETSLTKTEIAERLGVNRRTVMLWSQQGNWAKLKMSAQHMPSMVAEKCYYLLDQYASRFLEDGGSVSTLSRHDADTINKLASTIRKLKNRSATNESMEMFNFFLQDVKRQNPEFAADLVPYIERYLEARKDVQTTDFLLEEFSDDGTIPFPVKQMDEKFQDQRDAEDFQKEFERTGNYEEALESWQKGSAPPPPFTYDFPDDHPTRDPR